MIVNGNPSVFFFRLGTQHFMVEVPVPIYDPDDHDANEVWALNEAERRCFGRPGEPELLTHAEFSAATGILF